MDDPQTLVSTDWLAARLGSVLVLDASFHLDGRDAEAEHRARLSLIHI